MSRRCQNCRNPLGRWHYIKFYRMFSVTCPQCQAPLAISNRGRYTLYCVTVASIVLGILLDQLISPPEVLTVLVVVAGLAVGVFAASWVGVIGLSSED